MGNSISIVTRADTTIAVTIGVRKLTPARNGQPEGLEKATCAKSGANTAAAIEAGTLSVSTSKKPIPSPGDGVERLSTLPHVKKLATSEMGNAIIPIAIYPTMVTASRSLLFIAQRFRRLNEQLPLTLDGSRRFGRVGGFACHGSIVLQTAPCENARL